MSANYADLLQFYARQLRLLDDGHVEEWAGTFTVDGVLRQAHRTTARKGRAEIADGLRRAADGLRARGAVRRHWVGNLTIESTGDTIHTRFYALVIESTPENPAHLHLSTDIRDELVPVADSWEIRERTIIHDPDPVPPWLTT
ncbi:nuclear transport factor 2 family protein [Nocardia sp. AG03]|uniref:nuclear transport factor 2 family protein n=1 Tax=Nocardia sp. AG03 TaxID=3025312 RepID=UPI0024183E52|nr:nuclear transport factor 2 family protein [Nocardia sp. AG03]